MNIVLDKGLRVGWMPGKWAPPQLACTFMVKGTFKLVQGKPAVFHDKPEGVTGDIPTSDAEGASLRYESDFAPNKLRTDVMCVGTAYTPDGKPATAVRAGFGVGKFEKRVVVTGPRVWNRGMLTSRPGDPQPFLSLPLTYENAFGGADYPLNPCGKGMVGDLMPQIELEDHLLKGSRDKPLPAGFGPLARTWAQRNQKMGHYDAIWLKERWPWFPKDFNWEHFNAAPRDQQLDGYLKGDEPIYFQNMHPKLAHYAAALPGLRARCFVQDTVGGKQRFREAAMRLDTLWADMDAEKLVLVWRGQLEIEHIKLKNLEYVFAVSEPLAEAPKSIEYWRGELEKRVAVPPEPPPEPKPAKPNYDTANFAVMTKEMNQLQAELAKQEAAHEAHIAQNIKQLQAKNLPVTPFLAKPPYGPQTLAQVPAFLKQMETLANANHAASLAQLAASGKPGVKLPAEMMQPLRFQLPSELNNVIQLQQQAAATPAAQPQPLKSPWTRERVQQQAKAGFHFRNENLNGLDLSGLDLKGAKFGSVRLGDAKLDGCNLEDADLSDAQARSASFNAAKLARANLRAANLCGAKLGGVDLTGARIDDTNFTKAELTGAKLDRATSYGANFAEAALGGASFTGASLDCCSFAGAALEKANFKGSKLLSSSFLQANAKGADFSDSELPNFRGHKGNFEEAKFARSKLGESAWTEANLKKADFSHADIPRALFDFVTLEGALLGAVDATSSIFADSNLKAVKFIVANGMRCNFDRCNLALADFQGANLYQAQFWDAVTDGADFRNANLARAHLAK